MQELSLIDSVIVSLDLQDLKAAGRAVRSHRSITKLLHLEDTQESLVRNPKPGKKRRLWCFHKRTFVKQRHTGMFWPLAPLRAGMFQWELLTETHFGGNMTQSSGDCCHVLCCWGPSWWRAGFLFLFLFLFGLSLFNVCFCQELAGATMTTAACADGCTCLHLVQYKALEWSS